MARFRRGDENRPYPSGFASTRLNGEMYNMVPFIVPPGNRNVAGDFHRPYEGRVPFTPPPEKSGVTGDFHRPYGRKNRIGVVNSVGAATSRPQPEGFSMLG